VSICPDSSALVPPASVLKCLGSEMSWVQSVLTLYAILSRILERLYYSSALGFISIRRYHDINRGIGDLAIIVAPRDCMISCTCHVCTARQVQPHSQYIYTIVHNRPTCSPFDKQCRMAIIISKMVI